MQTFDKSKTDEVDFYYFSKKGQRFHFYDTEIPNYSETVAIIIDKHLTAQDRDVIFDELFESGQLAREE